MVDRIALPVLAAVETIMCYRAVVLLEVVKKRNRLSTLTLLCHETARGSKEGQVIMSTALSWKKVLEDQHGNTAAPGPMVR